MKRFPVRPQPIAEESLTGYMMRIAAENDVPQVGDFFAALNIYYSKNIKRRAYQWDMFPYRVADVRRMCQWMSLSEHKLDIMTFTPLIRKLHVNVHETSGWYKNSVSSSLVKAHRRFCPMCLKENGAYKLLWQVAEIEICDIHLTRLQSTCSICATSQPYVTERLGVYKCVNDCGFLFDEVPVPVEDAEFISAQLTKYRDWRFLLDPNMSIIPHLDGMSPEKSLQVALLYITQEKPTEFNPELNVVLSKENILDMRRFVTEDADLSKIQLDRILTIIRKAGLSPQEFAQTTISAGFVKSLFDWPKDILQPCQTPWCPARGETRSMVRIKHHQHVRYHGVKYIKHSVCTECWVQYGEDSRDGQWKSVGDFVILADQVRVLLEQGYSRRAIGIQLGIKQRLMGRIVGYLLFHRLLNENVWEALRPVTRKPFDLLERFRKTIEGGGSSLAKAKSLYGWDEGTYYYFFADPEIQRYYIFEAFQHRRFGIREAGRRKRGNKKAEWETKVNEALRTFTQQEIDITVTEIATSIGISDATLRYHGLTSYIREAIAHQQEQKNQQRKAQLLEVAQQYIAQKKADGEPVLVEKVCSFLGYSSSQHLKTMFPEVADWISMQAIMDTNERKQQKGERYKAEAKRIIGELYAKGQKITNELIAKQMGTTILYLRRYYPEVVSYIWKMRGRLADDLVERSKERTDYEDEV